jgi:putative ABC transport system substrate-binding protein
LARPGGNITGFAGVESGQNTKFLELLKEIVPGITRVAILSEKASKKLLALVAAIRERRNGIPSRTKKLV